jgi:iron-sulfur cluster assembly protein
MLAISPVAADAITDLVSQPGIPEGAGLRMSEASPGEPGDIELAVAEGPAGSDQIVEERGAQVFVDKELAPVLDDKILDATVESERVKFTLVKQDAGQS